MDIQSKGYLIASVLLVIGCLGAVGYLVRKAWVTAHTVGPTWYQRASLTDLRAFAKGSPRCTIARQTTRAGKIHYIPVSGILQVENHVRSEIPRYGWQRFTHPAFDGGELIVNYEGYLESRGYLLKKGTIAESE